MSPGLMQIDLPIDIYISILLSICSFCNTPLKTSLKKKAKKKNVFLNSKEMVEKAKQFITDLFDRELDASFVYHNIDHTILVFQSATEIGKKSGLSAIELEILQISALFHDSGFIHGAENHEKSSQKIATDFLSNQGRDQKYIDEVNLCISATKMGEKTNHTLALILQDADMAGLGNVDYPKIAERLRIEMNHKSKSKVSKKKWRNTNMEFLKNCIYNTDIAKEMYNEQKERNLKILSEKLDSKNIKDEKEPLSIAQNKSAQTQFKTALRNHIDLSNIADNKANIMISVNALILTVALPFLIDKAMVNQHFWLPTIILAAVCLISMIFATLATRPIKLKGITTFQEVQSNSSNLFFFGNYHKMKYEDYKKGVSHILNNPLALEDSIIRDLFFLGKSLGGKFSYLRLCYSIFMYGISIVVFSLLIVYFN